MKALHYRDAPDYDAQKPDHKQLMLDPYVDGENWIISASDREVVQDLAGTLGGTVRSKRDYK